MCVVLSIGILFLISSFAKAEDKMVIHFIDVGQGDAILVEFPCGSMLIDTGAEVNTEFNGKEALIKYLSHRFESTNKKKIIDLLVLTHPHKDHVLAASALIDNGFIFKNIVDDGLIDSRLKSASGGRQSFFIHQWAADNPDKTKFEKITIDKIAAGKGYTSPILDPITSCEESNIDPKIIALWGGSGDVSGEHKNVGNHSIVLKVVFGNASALFTGDIESTGINDMLNLLGNQSSIFQADIYKVADHGSTNGTTVNLLKAVHPRAAFFMASPFDRQISWTAFSFGYPRKDAIEKLTGPFGASESRNEIEVPVATGPENFETLLISRAVYGTSWDGNIIVVAKPDRTYEIKTNQ